MLIWQCVRRVQMRDAVDLHASCLPLEDMSLCKEVLVSMMLGRMQRSTETLDYLPTKESDTVNK